MVKVYCGAHTCTQRWHLISVSFTAPQLGVSEIANESLTLCFSIVCLEINTRNILIFFSELRKFRENKNFFTKVTAFAPKTFLWCDLCSTVKGKIKCHLSWTFCVVSPIAVPYIWKKKKTFFFPNLKTAQNLNVY